MHSSTLLLALTSTLLAPAVQAHGFVRGVSINSKWTNGSDPVWFYYPAASKPITAGWDALNQDIGFVAPSAASTSDINCHKSATAGKAYVSVNAGDTINFVWNTWPSDSHKGPQIDYIAPCDGECTTLASSSLRWSKIAANGYVNGKWATDPMPTNNYTLSTVLPKKLKAGNYVIRHEIIALHGAQNANGAQLYMQCLNLKVGGSGTVAPTSGVPGTSLYTPTMAGILFNLYTSFSSYPIPGPALWTAAN